MKWARDYRSDGFSVWTSDELNVNSPHGGGGGWGWGWEGDWGRQGQRGASVKQTKHLLTSVSEPVLNALNWSVRE